MKYQAKKLLSDAEIHEYLESKWTMIIAQHTPIGMIRMEANLLNQYRVTVDDRAIPAADLMAAKKCYIEQLEMQIPHYQIAVELEINWKLFCKKVFYFREKRLYLYYH